MPGSGLSRVGVVGLPQHVEDGAQLPQPLLAGGLDRLQGFGGRLRAGGQDVGGHPGLHVDGGHGVGDDVVQFAGDAQPLLVDAPAGRPVRPGRGWRPRRRAGSPPRSRRSSAAATMPGIRKKPPPLKCPNGLFTAVAVISTTSVAAAAMTARRTLSWVATVYRARTGATRDGAVDVAEQRVDGHRGGRDDEHGDRVAAPPGQDQAGDRDQQQRRARRAAPDARGTGSGPTGWWDAFAVGTEHQEDGHQHGQKRVRDRRADHRRHAAATPSMHASVGISEPYVALPRLISGYSPGSTRAAANPAAVRPSATRRADDRPGPAAAAVDLQLAERPPARGPRRSRCQRSPASSSATRRS